ncbi:MAG: tetratricopeptide repeat protein [Ignavibacteriaceae bacterium]
MDSNYNKIFRLLGESGLGDDYKNYLNDISAKDPEIKSFFAAYSRLDNIIKNSSHIPTEELGDYILKKNKFNERQSDSSKKIILIENHLYDCKTCKSVYEELSEEFYEVENAVDKYFDKSGIHEKVKVLYPLILFKNNYIRYAIVSTVSMIILFLGLEILSGITTPNNYRLGQIKDKSLSYITRGRSSFEFQEGLTALGNGNYDKAIKLFENDIANNKNGISIFYTHYILGLAYLESAKNDFVGLFPSFDFNKVRKAIDNFNLCISENSSGNYPDISFNSYFYMAKAELIRNNFALAKKYLQIVINNKGSKMNLAIELLDQLK